jgi:L-asparagine transporter-like permease
MKVKKIGRKKAEKKKRFEFGKINMMLFISALLFIIVGFIIVNSSTNFGVILLVLGYAVLVPFSLLIKTEKNKDEATSQKKTDMRRNL